MGRTSAVETNQAFKVKRGLWVQSRVVRNTSLQRKSWVGYHGNLYALFDEFT